MLESQNPKEYNSKNKVRNRYLIIKLFEIDKIKSEKKSSTIISKHNLIA